MTVFEKIEAQQKGRENTAPWMVGEQLKDICRSDPECAALVDKDLDNPSMSIAEAEKKIKAWADKNKSGGCAVVPPNVAEKIIREFYGLPELPDVQVAAPIPFKQAPARKLSVMDLV